MLKKIKADIINLTKEVTELKKTKKYGDRHNYSYWALEYNRKYWYWKIPIWHKGQRIMVESAASITDEMVAEQKINHAKYSKCVSELESKRYTLRCLLIIYGQMRGKTREQVEPKFNLNKCHNYNPVTIKALAGDDPIDWSYIQELKREYLPVAEERP